VPVCVSLVHRWHRLPIWLLKAGARDWSVVGMGELVSTGDRGFADYSPSGLMGRSTILAVGRSL
jgi:hypothetical protein